MNNLDNITTQAYNHYKKCSCDYDSGHIWNGGSFNIKTMRNIIENETYREHAIEFIDKTDLFNIYSSDNKVNQLRKDWHKTVFSLNYAKSKKYLERIRKFVEPKTVLEIGVGLGNIAVDEKFKYIGIDIPETLFFAYLNCRESNPNKKVVWYETVEDLVDFDILFIPIGKENIIESKKFDVAINTNSFGELSSDKQKYWIEFLEHKVNLSYFFSLNRFLNIIDDDGFGLLRKKENSYNMIFKNKWNVESWEVEPDYTQCPYEETKAARCLEIIFNCKSIDNTPFDRNIFKEDWNRMDWYAFGCLSSRTLRADMALGGTLFKLWNEYRLTGLDLDLFKKYLRYIGDSHYKFEEEYYGI